MATLGEMADICRSKNAGPFLLTVDFLFRDKAKYEAVKNSNTLQSEEIAAPDWLGYNCSAVLK